MDFAKNPKAKVALKIINVLRIIVMVKNVLEWLQESFLMYFQQIKKTLLYFINFKYEN
jgi:hypothetical protein